MKKLLLTLCMLLTSAPAFAQDRNDERRDRNARQERGREERGREQAQDQTDWDAEYTAYLKENPSVAKAVESGRISKEKVLAGIKARAADAWEAKLKRFWEYEKRDDPRRWVGKTFEQVRPELEQMLREEPDGWERDNEEEAAELDPWEAKFQVFLRQNPALREHLVHHGLTKENVIKLLQHGDANLDENDKAAQRARSEKALRAALKVMTDTKKLKPEQAKQLYEIVFLPVVDWEAKYEAYLKENPGIANAVANGKTTKEKVMVGIKAREREKPLTEEQKIEALYQKLQREDRTLGRTTKEQLMPQLKKMLARGEAEGLRPEQSQQPRTWTWGLAFNNLIETGQIERNGKDQKLVCDFGCIEILRQSGTQRPTRRGGEDERNRGERAREPNETAEARAQRAMKAASKIMTDAGKLKAKQATELYAIVFPEDIDWDAKYEAYLKENSGVARAVDSGKITKEKVMAGIKARSGEKAPTEEEQLEALYHKLLKDEPNLGRTPKVDLMPRLKRMLERGEGKNLRPEKTTRQRGMTFGLYFNNLIESGQVERSDKDMQLVFDIGASEISRQEEGEREDRVRERRIDEERRR